MHLLLACRATSKRVHQLQQRGFIHPQKIEDAQCRMGGEGVSPTRDHNNLILSARGIFFFFCIKDPDLHPSRKGPTGYLSKQTACTYAQPLKKQPPPSLAALLMEPSWPHPAPPLQEPPTPNFKCKCQAKPCPSKKKKNIRTPPCAHLHPPHKA